MILEVKRRKLILNCRLDRLQYLPDCYFIYQSCRGQFVKILYCITVRILRILMDSLNREFFQSYLQLYIIVLLIILIINTVYNTSLLTLGQ